MSALSARLAGRHVMVLNWRDVRHPQAGGAETYMHQIARRWVADGVVVTWITSRPRGLPAKEMVDGIRVRRVGGTFTLYLRAASRLLRGRHDIDAVIDCQNGIPFFSPILVSRDVPVIQVVHHVHQDQFGMRFPGPVAALGRFLEGPLTRRVYGRRATVAVSPSTRSELRTRLGMRGPIFVVPNGSPTVPDLLGPRDPDPTLVLVTRLVPHKRVDLLLGELAVVAPEIRGLRVEIVGDGPERPRLEGLATDLGLERVVTFHGRQPDSDRDELLRRAWVTVSASAWEGWGCSVIEAAAWGVPCIGLRVPGIRDSIVDGITGWLVDRPSDLGRALGAALRTLANGDAAQRMATACQEWTRCFSWERSADLLAGVLLREMSTGAPPRGDRRDARSDMSSIAHFPSPVHFDVRGALRSTDEIIERDGITSVLLSGCDEFDATSTLRRMGVTDADVRLGGPQDVLAGPKVSLRPEVVHLGRRR